MVSVIMGAYNIEHLTIFGDSIATVLSQTYTDFELIICDDGSTDKTWDLLQVIENSDGRVRLIRNDENRGLAAALNHCIEVSRGIYIARHDTDDFSHPMRFKKQLEYLKKHPEIGFVGSDVVLFDELGDWRQRSFPEFPKPEDFLFTLPFIHGSLMFRREPLIMVGLYRVSKETLRNEDYDLLMRMYKLGYKGANIKESLYRFLEDRNTHKRRKYSYRINDVKVLYKGFKALGLLPKGLPYVVKPMVVGLIPRRILRLMKKRKAY